MVEQQAAALRARMYTKERHRLQQLEENTVAAEAEVRRAEESVRRAREGRKRALYQQQGTLAERETDASTDRPESTADNSHHGHLWNYTAGRSVLQLPLGGSHSQVLPKARNVSYL